MSNETRSDRHRKRGRQADLDATDGIETDDADAERTAAALVELKARGGPNWPLWRRCWRRNTAPILVEGEPDARSMGMGAGRKTSYL